MSFEEKEELGKILNDLLARKVIRESDSPYASPIVLSKRKNLRYRLCVDYRFLNKVTLRDNYPLPLIEDQIDRSRDERYFTLLDFSTFQRFINKVFDRLIKSGGVVAYLDDILVASESMEEHLVILKEVFNLMVNNKLQLRVERCKFFQTELEYLGYFPIPQNIREVQSFLWLCSYFGKFIEGFSASAKGVQPLYCSM